MNVTRHGSAASEKLSRMNLAELQKKLIAAAKTEVLDDRVPYAFEKRVTALLASRVPPQDLDIWVRGFWRAAVSCAAIAITCGLLALLAPVGNSSDDLSLSLDKTLLASVNQSDQAQ